MNEEHNKLIIESVPNQERANALMEKLFTITKPTAVFSTPVKQDNYTVITASELHASIGFGYGGGGGTGENEESGFGGGGGGGGTSTARPVAAVIISSNGVHVEPIVDPTKIALAFFTIIGSIFLTMAKVRKFRKSGKLD